MIADLPMYARPHNRAAHDALWQLIAANLRDAGIAAPNTLAHDPTHEALWGRPDLVLGQICNLPLRAGFGDRVTVIGAGDYALPDTVPGYYHSVYVVRRDDAARDVTECKGYGLAISEAMSHSGWGSIHAHAAELGLALHPRIITGAHRASLAAVADGRADLAAIDAQCWWMDKDSPASRACRVIGRTPQSPGQSFITAGHVESAPYFAAISAAIADLASKHRAILGLRGIVRLPHDAYALPIPPHPQILQSSAA